MFHLAWPFLEPMPTTLLCVSSPVISCYGKLRAKASYLTAADIHRFRTPLDHRTSTSACNIAKLLLLCNFRPGGMIRFLGGVYTSDFLDFASIDACIIALSDILVNPGETSYDFPGLQRLLHQHITFKASFQISRRDMLLSNR